MVMILETSTQSGILECKVLQGKVKSSNPFQGVYIKGDMKLIAGSYSILRRREHKTHTVFLYNVTEDTNELNDLR